MMTIPFVFTVLNAGELAFLAFIENLAAIAAMGIDAGQHFHQR
jgi:hypothetical protein